MIMFTFLLEAVHFDPIRKLSFHFETEYVRCTTGWAFDCLTINRKFTVSLKERFNGKPKWYAIVDFFSRKTRNIENISVKNLSPDKFPYIHMELLPILSKNCKHNEWEINCLNFRVGVKTLPEAVTGYLSLPLDFLDTLRISASDGEVHATTEEDFPMEQIAKLKNLQELSFNWNIIFYLHQYKNILHLPLRFLEIRHNDGYNTDLNPKRINAAIDILSEILFSFRQTLQELIFEHLEPEEFLSVVKLLNHVETLFEFNKELKAPFLYLEKLTCPNLHIPTEENEISRLLDTFPNLKMLHLDGHWLLGGFPFEKSYNLCRGFLEKYRTSSTVRTFRLLNEETVGSDSFLRCDNMVDFKTSFENVMVSKFDPTIYDWTYNIFPHVRPYTVKEIHISLGNARFEICWC